MAQPSRVPVPAGAERPYWSQLLRALREARGITQAGWALNLGYGRATVKRWEAGETVPSADAEAALLALCRERELFRDVAQAPLAGVRVTPAWLADLLAAARLDASHRPPPPLPSAPAPPTTQYALSGDVAIAYQVFGAGPVDLIITPGFVSHRELDWEHPGMVRFYTRLAQGARVIVFDKRGTGMSDRVPVATLDERMDDIRAVMDAAGCTRAALLGISEGGPMSVLFAATYPARTTALVLFGTYARARRVAGYPFGGSTEQAQQWVTGLRRTWGRPEPSFLQQFGPSVADDPVQRAWWARYCRLSASPGAVSALIQMEEATDVRTVLPALRLPTLVLHRAGDVERSRQLADAIPGARFVALPGIDHFACLGDVDALADAVATFLTSRDATRDREAADTAETFLTTILCAEFVHPAGTATAPSRLWPRQRSYEALVRSELARCRGRADAITDEGVRATFDGPGRAVRYALTLRNTAGALGLALRASVHTGEVQLHGGRIAGPAVAVAAALAAIAEPGEVLVTGTVTDLVAGADVQFAGRGTRRLAGVPGRWRLFAVQ